MSKNNANNPQNAVINVGTYSTAGSVPLMVLPKKSRIKSIYLLDQAGIAADNTNYVTLQVKLGSTVIASLDTRAANQGAVTALVAKAFAIVAGQEEQAAGSSLALLYAEGGSGTLTLGQIQIEFYPL